MKELSGIDIECVCSQQNSLISIINTGAGCVLVWIVQDERKLDSNLSVCVRACVRACVRVCVRVCVRACVRVCVKG